MPQTPPAPAPIVYPETDGMPLPEGGFQFDVISYAVPALRVHFADRADVFVAGNMFIYDEEGNPNSSLAPDVFVVYGIPNHTRETFLLWEERTPDFVLEIASTSTWQRDRVEQPRRYAAIGVKEYWQYDLKGTMLDPPLRGAALDGARYAALPSTEFADGAVEAYSPALGLYVRMTDRTLRFRDPETGRNLPTHQEIVLARKEIERQTQEDVRARQEIKRQIREDVRARWDAERRVQEEIRARQDAEARIAVIEARIRALQRSSAAQPPADDRRS